MRETTDLDRIIASTPADRLAGLVIAPGEHWEPERPKHWPGTSYDAPPRTIRTSAHVRELRGIEYGRITVVGLLKAKQHNWNLWLVRCRCGAYEDRTSRAIEGKAGDACWRCDKLIRLQTGRPAELVPPRKRPKPKPPSSIADVILSARSVRRAAGMEPRTAMQLALSRALAQRDGI